MILFVFVIVVDFLVDVGAVKRCLMTLMKKKGKQK
jgi:hypothetical protein